MQQEHVEAVFKVSDVQEVCKHKCILVFVWQ